MLSQLSVSFQFTDIFIDAIRSLDIKIVQTYGEADRFIAHQASRVYQCPVLSNDSDFLIYSSVELVLLRSVDLENGIRCQRFKREAFLKFFGLESDKLLPLAARYIFTYYFYLSMYQLIN